MPTDHTPLQPESGPCKPALYQRSKGGALARSTNLEARGPKQAERWPAHAQQHDPWVVRQDQPQIYAGKNWPPRAYSANRPRSRLFLRINAITKER